MHQWVALDVEVAVKDYSTREHDQCLKNGLQLIKNSELTFSAPGR